MNSAIYETRKHRFNQYKNTLRKTITEAKKRYFSNRFGRYEGNGKKTWKTIDNALHRKSRKAIADAISVNTKLSTNKQGIANEFNKYFATICANNHTPTTNRSYKSYLKTRPRSTFNFKLIDNTTTLRYLSNLNLSHSCGHDNLSTVILKYIAKEITECLTLIINQSITTGIFPDQLKIAKVVPIFKKDDQAQIKNYRPISVLPVISKIFENAMHIPVNGVFYISQLTGKSTIWF